MVREEAAINTIRTGKCGGDLCLRVKSSDESKVDYFCQFASYYSVTDNLSGTKSPLICCELKFPVMKSLMVEIDESLSREERKWDCYSPVKASSRDKEEISKRAARNYLKENLNGEKEAEGIS